MNTRQAAATDPVQVTLVGCGNAKRDEAVEAAELYDSTYFDKKWAVAESQGDIERILSAKYGLLRPDRVVEPYDASLVPRHDSYIGAEEVARWGEEIEQALHALVAAVREAAGTDVEIEVVTLAGEAYAEHVEEALAEVPVTLRFPFRGRGGLPGQMRWLSKQLEDSEQ